MKTMKTIDFNPPGRLGVDFLVARALVPEKGGDDLATLYCQFGGHTSYNGHPCSYKMLLRTGEIMGEKLPPVVMDPTARAGLAEFLRGHQ